MKKSLSLVAVVFAVSVSFSARAEEDVFKSPPLKNVSCWVELQTKNKFGETEYDVVQYQGKDENINLPFGNGKYMAIMNLDAAPSVRPHGMSVRFLALKNGVISGDLSSQKFTSWDICRVLEVEGSVNLPEGTAQFRCDLECGK